MAFQSDATNLVPGDSNGFSDIFVHDRHKGETTRVSVASDGAEANEVSLYTAISADGRIVVFLSQASNLVSGDTNNMRDVFTHDRQTGQTTRVSVASDGSQADGHSFAPVISDDGRFVAFTSYAMNLVPETTNPNEMDIFVHDRQTGETSRVSVAGDGTEANGTSDSPAISADGRFVAFHSAASNLVPGDTNSKTDIFVHDRQTGETTRVFVASDGTQANDRSYYPILSGDGRFVIFGSR